MEQKKQYKRQYRQLSQIVKDKISKSLSGVRKSPSHAAAISAGLKSYWEGVKDKPTTDDNNSLS